MNSRINVAPMLIALVYVALPAQAQQPVDPTTTSTNPLINNYGSPFGQSLGKGLEDPPRATPTAARTTSLSPWILGANSHPDGCCGPQGANGSISWDLYLRNGIAVSYGNPFAGDLSLGWAIQGGARALLFDVGEEAAWVVDFGITNVYQTCGGDHTYRLTNIREPNAQGQLEVVPERFVTGDEMNRTLVGISLGRELWLMGNARQGAVDGCDTSGTCCGCGSIWRAGWDVGGRWGSAKFQPNEIRHMTAVIGGVFLAAHTDMEIPCGACTFLTGFRVEWGYTWSDIIQRQNRADIQEFLFLWNLGVRF